MTESGAEAGLMFLGELAGLIGASAALYVPRAERPAVHLAGAGDSPVPALEPAGRDWLVLATRSTDEARTEPPPDPKTLFAPARSAVGEIVGVVVAAKADTQWSERERAVFTMAVEHFSADLDARVAEPPPPPDGESEPDFEAALRAAAGNDELTLAYQPEVDLVTRRVLAVEALVRWQHPRFGELGPEWFISLAERSDVIKIVGGWVIDESIRTLASWNAELPGLDVMLRVNVSPVQIAGEDIASPIAAALAKYHVAGSQVCIELTENAPLTDPGEVADSLRRLQELGVTSAIDDLATGFSSLSHLRILPVDMIKLDRSLVSGIDTDRRAQAIVTALVGLGLNFGLGVIAEGVENDREAATLLELGCTRAQGHHLGMPASAAAILEILREQGRNG
jgi:EAL domain-containing protein (putative c-di-GMP-specific phosphodiesterase class I)